MSHRCTYVPPNPEPCSHLPPHPIPLGFPRALASGALLHAWNLYWSSILHMVIYTCTPVFITALFIIARIWAGTPTKPVRIPSACPLWGHFLHLVLFLLSLHQNWTYIGSERLKWLQGYWGARGHHSLNQSFQSSSLSHPCFLWLLGSKQGKAKKG